MRRSSCPVSVSLSENSVMTLYRVALRGMLPYMAIDVLCLLHHPRVGAGTTTEWARDRGHRWTTVDLHAGEALPDAAGSYDLIVLTGGPMGVYDAPTYPWIIDELAFIRAAIDADCSVIGLCLGAQLIAAAMGAEVAPHAHQEIGWWPVRKLPGASDNIMLQHLPDEFVAMMWHGDTFEIPSTATHLATSNGCERQAFSAYGNRVLGVQFHPEFSMIDIHRLLAHNTLPTTNTSWIQSSSAIASGIQHAETMHAYWWEILDRFVAARADHTTRR